MSGDPLVQALIGAMTPEQKQELVNSLLSAVTEDLEPTENPELKTMNELQNDHAAEKTVRKPRKRKPSKPKVTVNDDFTVTREGDLESQKRPVRAQENQWVDTGEDGRDEKTELTPEQMEAMEKTMQPRDRPDPVEKKTVKCHVCNRDFDVDPSAIYGEYIRCDKCVRR